MVMESSGESEDGLTIPDVGDGVPHFQEMPDVASQRFPRFLMEFLQKILHARLLTHCHVILNKNSLKIIPRFNGVLPQAHKPIIGRLGEHNRQIVCHYVAVSPGGTYDDVVELHPLLGISLAIVGINPKDLEAYGPLYSS